MIQKPRLLDQVRDRIHFRHHSIHTEQAYLGWIRRFILFHKKRHLREMGAPEVEMFLSALAAEYNATESTRNQTHSTVFFYSAKCGKRPLSSILNADKPL